MNNVHGLLQFAMILSIVFSWISFEIHHPFSANYTYNQTRFLKAETLFRIYPCIQFSCFISMKGQTRSCLCTCRLSYLLRLFIPHDLNLLGAVRTSENYIRITILTSVGRMEAIIHLDVMGSWKEQSTLAKTVSVEQLSCGAVLQKTEHLRIVADAVLSKNSHRDHKQRKTSRAQLIYHQPNGFKCLFGKSGGMMQTEAIFRHRVCL